MTPISPQHRLRKPLLWTALALLLATLTWAFAQSSAPPTNLAADLPPGALLTLESPDFATLLHTWNQSPEQRAWLTSANYSAYANSHVFSRLADAQDGFANAAKVGLDTTFLQQVAGRESIFAWYNIGNLEFLYITHLPHEQTTRLSLLQQRAHFARRESAGTPFYVRTATGPASADADTADSTPDAPSDGTGTSSPTLDQPRTVAFALRGDWLLLATREDLLANALQLMNTQASKSTPADSQATEGWFAAATLAGPKAHGDLRMLLDLQSLTKTPQFRSYWIQRNITDTRQYRAAVVDLYREPTQFREERTLLPVTPTEPGTEPDLGALEALVPEHTGTYRAVALPTSDLALMTIQEKLFPGVPEESGKNRQAPPDTTAVTGAGSAADLDVRIDTPPPVPDTPELSLAPLRDQLEAVHLQSMLTIQRTDPTTPNQPFVRPRAAVILHAGSPWDDQALTAALNTALSSRFTTATLGLGWQRTQEVGFTYRQLIGPHPMALYSKGSYAILANDAALLTEILSRQKSASLAQVAAQLITAVRPTQETANFRRLTHQLAETDASTTPGTGTTSTPALAADTHPVRLFADNLPSLADTFPTLATERLLQRQEGPNTHQTVIYTWIQPLATRH